MRTGWWDAFNPFSYLGDAVADAAAGIWTMVMVALWNSGLWILRLEFAMTDALTTPDISAEGPVRTVYQVTFWMAGALVVIFVMLQLGVTLIRRDGESLARALIGSAQFGLVVTAWLSYGAAIVAACAGLTRALAKVLLGVDQLSSWEPWGSFSAEDITDGVIATVLGVMGLLLWLSGIARLLVMLVRGAGLVILAATAPVAAAGLVWEGGRAWFWKAFRWFHAAALTPVLMMLLLGIGVKISSGIVLPGDTDLLKAVATAIPAILIILVSSFSPLALFKLLAFTDPGSSSGAAMRQGLAANGGIQNLLSRGGSGSSSASSTGADGRAQGEAASEEATSSRFAGSSAGAGGSAGASTAGAGGSSGGAAAGAGAAGAAATGVGAVLAAGAVAYGVMSRVGTQGAAVMADLGNQAGVGHDTYQPDAPDFGRQRTDPTQRATAYREGDQEAAGSAEPERTDARV